MVLVSRNEFDKSLQDAVRELIALEGRAVAPGIAKAGPEAESAGGVRWKGLGGEFLARELSVLLLMGSPACMRICRSFCLQDTQYQITSNFVLSYA